MKFSLGVIVAIIMLLLVLPGAAIGMEPVPPSAHDQAPAGSAAIVRNANGANDNSIRLPGPPYWIYLPVISNATCNGLYGTVSDHGVKAQGVPLDLRRISGVSPSTVMTTSTDVSGTYCFNRPASLAAGQTYHVRYGPQSTNPNHLSNWQTRVISSYSTGEKVNIGDFDLADISLVSPAPGATVALPRQFTWTRRVATPSDSYELDLFNPANLSLIAFLGYSGYVDNYTLTSLPQGFSPNVPYGWFVSVQSPDGGFGISFYYHTITFSNAGSASVRPSIERIPADRLLVPQSHR